MIKKFKKFFLISCLIILNNCAVSGSAFLGPIYTGAKTGSVYQASLSYGTGKIINNFKSDTFFQKTNLQNEELYKKTRISFPDIPYIDKDPIILASYKVDEIKFSEITEPEHLP